MIALTLDEWKRKLDFPTGETVILHNPKVRFAPETLFMTYTPCIGFCNYNKISLLFYLTVHITPFP